jgi:hypothetical protein
MWFHVRFAVRMGARNGKTDTKSQPKSHLQFGLKKKDRMWLLSDTKLQIHQIASAICMQITHKIANEIARVTIPLRA